MKFPKMIPAFADLTQDIAGPLPLDLVKGWVEGTQDEAAAEARLGRFAIEGTVVSTDTSGLSRMTQERDLLDVLSMVSGPKEIVHALGTDIGGRAVGTWVADNTQMFYPSTVPFDVVIGAMLEAQARIAATLEVRIGMCAHHGRFFDIGSGLYGADADLVEYVAEQFAAPGEVLVTREVADTLARDAAFTLEPRESLSVVHAPGVFTVTSGRSWAHLPATNPDYPHGFTDEVFQALRDVRGARADDARTRVYRSVEDRIIVFAARERTRAPETSAADLLDIFVRDLALDAIVRHVPDAAEHVASLGGGIAILSFDNGDRALKVATAMRDQGVEMGLPLKVGMDAGPVLTVGRLRGPSGISGDAVNLASKLSEDLGLENTVSATTRAAARLSVPAWATPFTERVSRIELTGVRF